LEKIRGPIARESLSALKGNFLQARQFREPFAPGYSQHRAGGKVPGKRERQREITEKKKRTPKVSGTTNTCPPAQDQRVGGTKRKIAKKKKKNRKRKKEVEKELKGAQKKIKLRRIIVYGLVLRGEGT